ncbi:ABC transporter G family member 31 [Hondaea fermentalgiana]|uniref:ABC transporter G family member 31 n=1 Tax=Hondaea fermentalgiana TaxID=2315210 RepID=A0A2R5GYT7_9STRA|nr:ABC transporter G family member 31 [Hondaea fermentalgiana]|eukprot:GBG34978.1 ABC transporter G family member 31 [Hondaea fermentalgiana]
MTGGDDDKDKAWPEGELQHFGSQGSVSTLGEDEELNAADLTSDTSSAASMSVDAGSKNEKSQLTVVTGDAGSMTDPASVGLQPTSPRLSVEDRVRVRKLLGRLQMQAAAQLSDGTEGEEVAVKLSKDEIALLAELFGAGVIRAPSAAGSRLFDFSKRQLTGIELSSMVQRVRGDDYWPVHLGFRDLEYSVNVPSADVGIPTVMSTLAKLVSPLMNLVTCSRTERMDLPILRKISGSFEAGRPTLVLGPPGCGITTLFKTLSGRAKVGGRCKLKGEILYSGYDASEVHVRKMTSYVDQMDEHTAVMTVRETLRFAYECFGGAETARLVLEASGFSSETTEEEKSRIHETLESFPETVINSLALGNAADTIVGNELLRGVSGGERKRVTSAEMIMGRRPLAFMDQISTGLDSAATFDICRRLTEVARNLHHTPVVALLQPPPEVYELFDEILIMALGYIVYHGPRENVLPYFASIGFECPHDRDIADFILEVTTPAREIYRTRADAPNDEEAMAMAWQASPFSVKKRESIAFRCDPANKIDAAMRRKVFAKEASIFENSFAKDLKLVLRRQWQLVMRDPAFVKARIFQSLLMGIVIGTLFVQINPNLPEFVTENTDLTPITQRYGIMFSTLMQCALAGMAQIPVVLAQRPVFYKQSGSYFFRTINYVISETLAVLPIAIVEAIIMGTLVFWIAGLVPSGSAAPTGTSDAGSRFILFVLLMASLNISFGAYLRAIASFVPSAAVGQVVAGLSIAVTILYSGYIVTANAMPVWFKWIYWMSPISWGYRTGVLLVFKSSAFTQAQQALALGLFDFPADQEYIWGGYLILLGYWFVNMGLSYIGYSFIRHESGARQTKANPLAEDTGNPDVAEVESVMARQRSPHSAVHDEKNLGDGRNDAKRVISDDKGEVTVEMGSTLGKDSFTPVDLVFIDLWYAVPAPGSKKKHHFSLDLLKGITGYAEAGTLTALMGSSGAGKSTLMDVLALRKTGGRITGQVLVNGRAQKKTSFSRITGYVEQNDIHSPTATVEEALIFSAMLRQPREISREAKLAFVESVIYTLGLESIRSFKIGFKATGGLSTEQAKRLTIGVEMAANPAIIFADEPTSGLDANSARVVMDGLERIARAGRTVICTIHQPSQDIFNKFDRLLLLRRGGEMVYFGDLGPKSRTLLDYLQGIPGTKPMADARYNPATYMLEVVSAKSLVDYVHEYRESALRVKNEEKIEALVASNVEKRPDIVFEAAYASSFGTQLEQLSLRWLRAYWRNPAYNTTRFVIAVFISVFFGSTFYQKAAEIQTTQDAQSFMGLIFISTTFMGVIALYTAIPTVMDERAPFYRERASSYYSIGPMAIAITTTELPYIVGASLVFVPIFYFLVHLWHDARAFFLFWAIYLAFQMTLTFWGHLLAAVAPNQAVATILAALSFGFWTISAGLYIAVRDMPAFWSWLPCLNPLRFALNGLSVVQLVCENPLEDSGPGCSTLSTGGTAWNFVQGTFGYAADDWQYCLGALLGFAFGFRVLAVLAHKYISHLKR